MSPNEARSASFMAGTRCLSRPPAYTAHVGSAPQREHLGDVLHGGDGLGQSPEDGRHLGQVGLAVEVDEPDALRQLLLVADVVAGGEDARSALQRQPRERSVQVVDDEDDLAEVAGFVEDQARDWVE